MRLQATAAILNTGISAETFTGTQSVCLSHSRALAAVSVKQRAILLTDPFCAGLKISILRLEVALLSFRALYLYRAACFVIWTLCCAVSGYMYLCSVSGQI